MSGELIQKPLTGELVSSSERRAKDSLPENTRIAYGKMLAKFRENGYSIPASPEQVAQFLENARGENRREYSLATLRLMMAAISYAHKSVRLADPCKDIEVSRAIKAIVNRRKNAGKLLFQRQAKPILKDDALLMTTRKLRNYKKELRDKALIIFGMCVACRRSELLSLRVEDLSFEMGGVVVSIRYSKTDQFAKGEKVYIPEVKGRLCPVTALKEWLNAAGITSGVIFRAINKSGVISTKPMSPYSLSYILKKWAEAAGIDSELISGHSLRAGFATMAALAGVPEHRIKQHGRWKSEVWRRYVRDVSGLDKDNPITKILG